ncbi:hypothetical protein STBA_10270 [Streptomyces sp. MP131-18]|nr:hypothetical protein STBA_10270 [Streptomyces sp. MP131-18]
MRCIARRRIAAHTCPYSRDSVTQRGAVAGVAGPARSAGQGLAGNTGSAAPGQATGRSRSADLWGPAIRPAYGPAPDPPNHRRPARVGDTAGEGTIHRSLGWSDTCAGWTQRAPLRSVGPGPAVVRPNLGRRFQIASERHIWPRSMRSSASFARAGRIGAQDAALSMRRGSPQLRTDRSPSTGQSQSPESSRSGGIGGPRFGRDGRSSLTIRRRHDRTRSTGCRLWRRTGALRRRGDAVPARWTAGRGGPPTAPVC